MLAKFSHIILSILLFLSSAGIVVNKHFCQNELKNFAIFSQAENCHTQKSKKAHCPKHAKQEDNNTCSPEKEKNCCSSESDYIVSETDFIKVQTELPDLSREIFLQTFVFSYLESLDIDFDFSLPSYLNYKPPLLYRDIPTLKQSYLC